MPQYPNEAMKRSNYSITKLVLTNLLVFLALISFILLMIPIAHTIYEVVTTTEKKGDIRANLPVYSDFHWAENFYKEFKSLDTEYFDYIGWRRKEFHGITIRIENGLRHTPQAKPQDPRSDDPVLFFGGSTTWGTGVNDYHTYPAVYSRITNRKTLNYGESSYVARQSLAYLQNLYITKAHDFQKTIVFYDGVNDVGVHCRSDNNGIASSREEQIRKKIVDSKYARQYRYSYKSVFAPLWSIARQLRIQLGLAEDRTEGYRPFICDIDPNRAQIVAQQLVETWRAASQIANSNGDKFVAILQPVAFVGTADLSYLKLDDKRSQIYAKQYRTVYPLIQEYAASIAGDFTFLDLTGIYNNCELCYVDMSHVGPHAHQLLATRLADLLDE